MDAPTWDEAVKALAAQNYPRARELFEVLSEHDEALLQLGFLYQEGLGGPREPEKAYDIYKRLAAANDPQGTYFLAKLLLSRSQLEEALPVFEKAAALSHASAAYWAAALYGGLQGYRKDDEKHLEYLRRAASLGHIYGQRDLALSDLRSKGGPIRKVGALVRYFRAISEGIMLTFRNRYDLRIR